MEGFTVVIRDLSYNQLTGYIIPELVKIPDLQYLFAIFLPFFYYFWSFNLFFRFLNNNEFMGYVPHDLGKIVSLRQL